MPETSKDNTAAPAPRAAADGSATLHQMHRAVWRFAAIRALVSIGCPQQLRGGPLPVTELARRCGADAPALARLLRTAATTGLLRTASPGTYALTAAGQALLDGTELLRIQWNADPEVWTALGELTETVRSGQAPFAARHGNMYRYLSDRPGVSAAFDALMVANHAAIAARLAGTSAFPATGTVVDAGGGTGTFLAAVLRARPGLRGILLDLERALPGARQYLDANGVGDRCDMVAGDFFAALPPGADAYLLAHVIHNWDDDAATQILRTVRAAIPRHGTMLLVEALLPGDDRPDFGKDLDVVLLATHNGTGRTQAGYFALLARAGFRPGQVTDLGALGNSLITATPA
jgi:O-methyltransferase domain